MSSIRKFAAILMSAVLIWTTGGLSIASALGNFSEQGFSNSYACFRRNEEKIGLETQALSLFAMDALNSQGLLDHPPFWKRWINPSKIFGGASVAPRAPSQRSGRPYVQWLIRGILGIIAVIIAWQHPTLGLAVFGLTLFPGYESPLLQNVEEHLLEAARQVGIPLDSLKALITPKRQIHVRFRFRLDNGNLSEPIDAWRFGMEEPSKGGIRAVPNVMAGDIVALSVDMDGKPSSAVQVEGLPLRGGKGGSSIDLTVLSTAEKVRWMRGWVSAVMDYTWTHEHRVAFGPLFDSPAPDKGTSPKDVNLMDYFADEYNRWLLRHATEVLPWLDLKDPSLAKNLRVFQGSTSRDPILFNRAGSQLELLFVERIIKLRMTEQSGLHSLRLLAAVTGKSAPNEDLPYGYGGILGRTEATGEGLVRAVWKWWQLLGEIPADSETLAGKSVTVEGFGNVGYWAAVAFVRMKANVTAIAEYDKWKKEAVVLYRANGFTQEALEAMQAYQTIHETLAGFENTPEGITLQIKRITKTAFWELPVDLVAPCATENTITTEVARTLGARYVGEGANGPTTVDADLVLQKRNIKRGVDIVFNSGGVITSYLEMLQDMEENGQPWPRERTLAKLYEMMDARVAEVFTYANKRGMSMGEALHELWLLGRSPSSGQWRQTLSRRLQAWREKNPLRRWRLRPFRSLRILHYPRRVFYLVEPENFRLVGQYNARMNLHDQPDPLIAAEQWRKLRDLLGQLGAHVIVDRGAEHVPDLAFAGDEGLLYEKDGIKYMIASRFRPSERRPETPLFEAAFQKRGYHRIEIPFEPGEFWESGDFLENGGMLYGGWGFRSDPSSHQKVAQAIGMPLANLHLVDERYYHLRTALAFLDDNTAMAYLPAFDEASQQELVRQYDTPEKRLIRLSEADAKLFAASVIVVGRKLVINTVTDELVGELSGLGFQVYRTPMSEFTKSGGAAGCSVLNTPAFQIFTWSGPLLSEVLNGASRVSGMFIPLLILGGTLLDLIRLRHPLDVFVSGLTIGGILGVPILLIGAAIASLVGNENRNGYGNINLIGHFPLAEDPPDFPGEKWNGLPRRYNFVEDPRGVLRSGNWINLSGNRIRRVFGSHQPAGEIILINERGEIELHKIETLRATYWVPAADPIPVETTDLMSRPLWWRWIQTPFRELISSPRRVHIFEQKSRVSA